MNTDDREPKEQYLFVWTDCHFPLVGNSLDLWRFQVDVGLN